MNKPPVSISARSIHGSNDVVPSIQAGRSPIAIDVGLKARRPIAKSCVFQIRAREIFTNRHVQCRLPLGITLKSGQQRTLALDIPASDLNLTPGCWVLIVDLLEKGRSLAEIDVGCAVVYAKGAIESVLHARASYNLAGMELLFNRKLNLYCAGSLAKVPATGDPFDDSNFSRYESTFLPWPKWHVWPEHEHDAGVGVLYGALVFHALGETDRARYCEKVLKRLAYVLMNHMHDGKGQLRLLDIDHGKITREFYAINQAGFALKYLCQVYFYFRFGPGNDREYARQLLSRLEPVYRYQVNQSLEGGRAESGCRVYDGRVLSGPPWYCLAYLAEHGAFPADVKQDVGVKSIIKRTVECGREMMAQNGWHDAGCFVEAECHPWCGNINMLNAFLPVLRIVRARQAQGEANMIYIRRHIEKSAREAFRFLNQTNGVVTNQTKAYIPTAETLGWLGGNLYELCQEYLQKVENDPGVEQLRDHQYLCADYAFIHYPCVNLYAAALFSSPEYRALTRKPGLPWDRPHGS